MIDVRQQVSSDPNYQLTVADIQKWERGGAIPKGALVLLLTGWGVRLGDAEKYRNADKNGDLHFPGFSVDSIKYLGTIEMSLRLESIHSRFDIGSSNDFGGHKLSHAAGLYHIEKLANLEKLSARDAVVFVGPLAIEDGLGSPARVLAIAA